MVAGEASGDRLGASLIRAVRERVPAARFEGVGGPLMIEAGLNPLFDMEPLAVMGLVDPIKKLPQLLRIRRGLNRHFSSAKPDLFLGIDAPDFNTGLELSLRRRGVLTAHYVSPSVWAWRSGRIKKIARAVDHMLVLLPFEARFYAEHDVPATFVGHPLADEIPLVVDAAASRKELGLPLSGPVVALLPGSRQSEISLLGRLFFETARRCRAARPNMQFVLPAANAARKRQIDALVADSPDVPVTVLDAQSHLAMAAADVVLLASGTTALEAMLLKKPMVVSYKAGRVTHAIVSRMLKVPHVSLPNLLAGQPLVPELLQGEATVENLTAAVLRLFDAADGNGALLKRFGEMHMALRQNADETAAQTLLDLIERRRGTGD